MAMTSAWFRDWRSICRASMPSVRLKIVREDGPAESAEALDRNAVDLAVVRRDLAMPKNGQVIAIQRHDIAVADGAAVAERTARCNRRGGTKNRSIKAQLKIEATRESEPERQKPTKKPKTAKKPDAHHQDRRA